LSDIRNRGAAFRTPVVFLHAAGARQSAADLLENRYTPAVMPPWTAERILSPDLARELIDHQFPELAPCRIEPLGFGWDNTAFTVNGEFVFRFPRRQLGADCLAHELRVLPALAGRLPLPIPIPIFIGAANDQFGWPFAGYHYLAGRTACSADLTEAQRSALASVLGEFLKSLHQTGAHEAQRLGAPLDQLGRLDPARRIPQVRQRLEDIAGLGLIAETASLRKVLDETAGARPARAESLVHGDLYLRHLLVDDHDQLSGIIDWGDVHCGDRALDLSIAFTFLPPDARFSFREAYGPIDDATWRLARFRALQYGTYLVPYAHAQNDASLLREALFMLHSVTA
jgi:aminoglycoside phosphotransferase (APT) family kinase protein